MSKEKIPELDFSKPIKCPSCKAPQENYQQKQMIVTSELKDGCVEKEIWYFGCNRCGHAWKVREKKRGKNETTT